MEQYDITVWYRFRSILKSSWEPNPAPIYKADIMLHNIMFEVEILKVQFIDTEEVAAATRTAKERAVRGEQEKRAAELEAAKWRTWTTADGKYKVEAKFIKLVAGTLTLEKKDGNTVDLKLDILCPEDREFVRLRKWTKPVSER